MTRPRTVLVVLAALAPAAHAQRWTDATARCLGTTAETTAAVALADLDGDLRVDIVLANGDTASEPSRAWRNTGAWTGASGACTEISAQAVGGLVGRARAVAIVDVDRDGDLDILTGGAAGTQLRLYRREQGTWTDATALLPQRASNVDAIAVADVDADGDLDLLLAEPGARPRLYLGNGQGGFTDATEAHLPDIAIADAFDIEVADVDGDWDLDVLVAPNHLFVNSGTGTFTAASLPAVGAPFDLAPIDVDGDGDVDLVAIGPAADHLLINDGTGAFTDETSTRLTGTANPASSDDRAAVWLDADSDGDPDLLVVAHGADRLLINTNGRFALSLDGTPDDTPSSRAVEAADLDGDGRLDLVHAQGDGAADRVQLATSAIGIDDDAPAVLVEELSGYISERVRAHVHDHKTPHRAHDLQRVWIEADGYALLAESAPPPHRDHDMRWAGGTLWESPHLEASTSYRVCATDRRNHTSCSAWVYLYPNPPPLHGDGGVDEPDAGTSSGELPTGCCDAGSAPGSSIALALVVLVSARSRRTRRRCGTDSPRRP